MKSINSKTLRKFIELAVKRLNGEWVIIGGTVLPLLGIDLRVTTDIDLIPLGNAQSNASVLELMRLSEELHLPIETVNQAGLYFLEKISDYRECLIVLKKSETATIYRPNVSLFVRLKIGRLSESDLSDCIELIRFAKKSGEEIDVSMLRKELQQERRKLGISAEKQVRLSELEKVLFE